ncbi:hypothetical protein EJD97_010676 [Solanum chilense]|uniref:Uncharacterized protein n=1 Tax=Solanum chilense TaxID=4083 RepID=A0A6N2AFK2_SOLCI|nr:hypothetical protein EJD97_010676 [Solanum chilense]
MVSLRTFAVTMLIFLVVFAPFVLSFHQFSQQVKVDFPDKENQEEMKKMGTEEDSARQIPTGPDPLHHNRHHPSKP